MIDYFISALIGFLIGVVCRFGDENDVEEQRRIYEQRYQEYEYNLGYYKNLTRKLVEENNQLRNKNGN